MTKIAIVGEAWGELWLRRATMEYSIKLTQGWSTKIDPELYDEISKFKWCVLIRSRTLAHAMRKDNGKSVFLHRFVIELDGRIIPRGYMVDHINGDGLDNRSANLRVVTARENALNSNRSRSAKIIEKHGNRFRVRPFFKGKRINLGSFATEDEARAVVEAYRNDS